MTEAAATSVSRWMVYALGAVCVAAGATSSALFLPRQSLWNDEATQMSGLSLDPLAQARWLADVEDHDFGVAEDRMPPLSYWIGWAWSRAFGLNERALRVMGLTATVLATLLLFAAGRHVWGTEAGVASALLFGLSPNVVVTSVEIRAYPLFMLSSAGLFYCLARLLADPAERQTRWLAGMTAFAVAGIFLHFFGLVAAGAAFLAALAVAPRRAGRLVPIIVCCAVVGLATLGLAPFVMASAKMSLPGERSGYLADMARLFYRLVFHASMRVNLWASVAAAAGVVLAAVACLTPAARGGDARRGMMIAWASGTLVVLAANFAISTFNPLASSYNCWMYPATALVLGSAVAAARPWARRLARLGVAALIAGLLFGDYNLATRGEAFAHTGFALVDEAVRLHGPHRTAVIYDEADNPWDFYAPLQYTYAGNLPQYTVSQGRDGHVRLLDYPAKKTAIDLESIPAEFAVVVRWGKRSADELVDQINGGYREIGDGAAARFLKGSSDWALVEEGRTLTYVQAEIDVLQRRSASPQPTNASAPKSEDAR